MNAGILMLLLQFHTDGDESSPHNAALQLASTEIMSSHVYVAVGTYTNIARKPTTSAHKLELRSFWPQHLERAFTQRKGTP